MVERIPLNDFLSQLPENIGHDELIELHLPKALHLHGLHGWYLGKVRLRPLPA